MDETMPDVIEEVKRAEIKTEAQRRELKLVQNEIINIKSETITTREKSQELKKSRDTTTNVLLTYEFESNHLEQKERKLLDLTLSEAKQKSLMEKSRLEDIHANIWQERQYFCAQVRQFNDKYGLLATSQPEDASYTPDEPKLVPKPQDDEELNALVLEIARLETELNEFNLGEPVWESQIQEATREIERLTNEPSVANEFIRLQGALNYCLKQIEIIESQCETVQQEMDDQNRLQLAMKPVKEKVVLQNSGYENPPKSDTNKTYPYMPRTFPSPKKVNPSYRQYVALGNHGLIIPMYSKPELLALKDDNRFQDIKAPSEVVKSSDDGDLSKHFQASDDGGWQCGIMDSPPPADVAPGNADEANQGAGSAKKRFIPKTPSAISMKLLTSKKSSLSLEQQLYNIIGRKPNTKQSQVTPTGNSLKPSETKTTTVASIRSSCGKTSVPLKGILTSKTQIIEKRPYENLSSVGVSISAEVQKKSVIEPPAARVPYLS